MGGRGHLARGKSSLVMFAIRPMTGSSPEWVVGGNNLLGCRRTPRPIIRLVRIQQIICVWTGQTSLETSPVVSVQSTLTFSLVKFPDRTEPSSLFQTVPDPNKLLLCQLGFRPSLHMFSIFSCRSYLPTLGLWSSPLPHLVTGSPVSLESSLLTFSPQDLISTHCDYFSLLSLPVHV